LAFFPILCAIEVVVGGGGGVTYRWAIRWRIITLLYYIRTEDGDVLRCDVMADECDRFVDDSESISRGLVRTVVVWSVRGSVCSFTSLSLSLSLFHADASPSVTLIFLHSISLCSKSLLLYTSYYYYVPYPYPPPQNIRFYILYAVVVVAARVSFYRPLRNINNNNNDTYICVKHILYIISVCVWGVPWRDVLPPP